MSATLHLSPDLAAQTPPEVLAVLEALQAENHNLKADKARLEALASRPQQRLRSSPEVADRSSTDPDAKARRARVRSRRRFKRALGLVLLLLLTLAAGAFIAWSLAPATSPSMAPAYSQPQ